MKKNLLKGVMAMAFAMFAMGTFAQGKTKVLTASGDTWEVVLLTRHGVVQLRLK